MPQEIDCAEIDEFLRSHAGVEGPRIFGVGQVVGEWRLTAFIGNGGSGEVYSARHAWLSLRAAVKVLSRDDAAARDRFRREAQILAEASIPAFPRFYGYGESEGRPYMVIELLEHLPLPKKDREVAQYLLKVCAGVEYLHKLGLVHRDIKPQNILQRGESGDPVIIDLGLVKDVGLHPAHEGVSLSIVDGKAVGVGTPRYSAPEQFSGGEISPAADIHALGMLANDCFGGNPQGCWGRIVRRSTCTIPRQRYGSVAEFMGAVRHRHRRAGFLSILVPLASAALIAAGMWLGRVPEEVVSEREDETTAVEQNTAGQEEPSPDTSLPKHDAEPEPQSEQEAGSESLPKQEAKPEPPTPARPVVYPRQGVFSGDKSVESDMF